MQLKVGTRLRSAVCSTEVIVVRAPGDDVELECGGYAMATQGTDATAAGDEPKAEFAEGTEVGKRYEDEAQKLEVLVTKAGKGSLSLGGVPLAVKAAKKLPTSD